MASKTVIVSCKLPHGIILDHPLDPTKSVELAGLNSSQIIGATHATTEVDAEFWDLWKTTNAEFAPLVSGAIFEAKDLADAKAKAKERAKEKTGFEQMPQEGQGVDKAES